MDWTQHQRYRRTRRIEVSQPIDRANDPYAGSTSRGQRKEQAWFGVEALREIGPHIGEDLRNALDRGPVGQRVYEPLEMEAPIVDVYLHKWRGVACSSGGYAKAAITQGKHGRNTKMMVLAPDIEQVRAHGTASLHGRPVWIVTQEARAVHTIAIRLARVTCSQHLPDLTENSRSILSPRER